MRSENSADEEPLQNPPEPLPQGEAPYIKKTPEEQPETTKPAKGSKKE
ncbi:MAG: hypothetical protein IKZ47_01085 [Clostridia bacterium]|nr:hypothetical protein [Clostridia bacterium]